MFGPHREVIDHDGSIVQSSRKGHPLGNNRKLHLPPHVLEHVEWIDLPCQASRYTVSTVACVLCGGGAQEGVT